MEVCTAEKQMDRRTGCLQANVEFLQQALAKQARETRDKLAAAARDLTAAKAEIATAKEEIAALKAAIGRLDRELTQMKAKAQPAPAK
jgi:predicted  nucleic acid-binding Zn-ribbon protein